MAVCGNCKSEGSRIRTIWAEDGSQRDECPNCSPTSFEKFTDPSDKKIWMGYEAHPNEYVKAADGGYDRKPEYRAEQEEQLRQETEEERTKRLKAEANKRSERRTLAMSPAEEAAAMAKAARYAQWLMELSEQGTDVVH